nr:helix-turn-helix transcriptional regulator [Kibdelosporangium sp. MJ126-NF4]CEL16856.1 Putative DNA-binding protein [Kibdelosporangium sp. MJ126-NF4]CTQ91916.1 transcriptional regulator, XRE family [Kibdelosporangium sp. MJ126-NF4]
MAGVPTRRKRALGVFLAKLREHADLTPEAVAKLLRRSASTVSRIETGHTMCEYSRLTALLGFYRATPHQRKQAEELWEEARQDAALLQHSTAMPPKYRAFLKAWDEARAARTFRQTMVPGPLQTPGYRATMYQVASRFIASPKDVQRDASSMEHRKERLRGPDALDYTVLLDEAVIRRTVGGPAIMADQLRHLLELGHRPNIEIKVFPFAAGEYEVMTGAVTWLGFAQIDYPDAVYLEYPSGGEWIEKADDVAKFAASIEANASLALTVDESAALIRDQAELLERGR